MKGFSKIRFVGGTADGIKDDHMPSSMCVQFISWFDGWMRINKDGSYTIIKGGEIDKKTWECYHESVYEKGSKKNGYIQYKHVRKKITYRCISTTKKGDRCRNEAINTEYCKVHKKVAA